MSIKPDISVSGPKVHSAELIAGPDMQRFFMGFSASSFSAPCQGSPFLSARHSSSSSSSSSPYSSSSSSEEEVTVEDDSEDDLSSAEDWSSASSSSSSVRLGSILPRYSRSR